MSESNLAYVPPPPSADNDDAQRKPGQLKGLMMPLDWIKQIADLYTSNRGIIRGAARLMRQKIPPEVDQFMADVAGGKEAEAMKEAQREIEGGQGQWQRPGTYPQLGEDGVPADAPGTPVMTDDMAEQAYYLNRVKHMGTLEIAHYFTDRGSPVSKATVARYIQDKEEEYEQEEQEARHAYTRRIQIGALAVAAWFGSAVGLHLLLNFVHLL